MTRREAALVLLSLASATVTRAGTVAGRVVLVQSGKDLANASNAVVWLEGPGARAGSAATRGEMASSSKRFQPRVVVVSKNGTVEFPNADSIYHNVFSVSGGNRFDLGLYRSGASKSKKFEEAGLVKVYCNIHPQMVGFVMVVDSAFAAITGTDGAFKFTGVPAGSYTLKAWHEAHEGAELAEPITVRDGGEAPVTVRIDTSAAAPPPHKNKYGKDYQPQAGESDDERY